MKRVLAVLFVMVLLSGCAKSDGEMDRVITLRDTLLKSSGCTFDSVITADYGDEVYTFSMQCKVDSLGNLSFIVTDPQTIAGITGNISSKGGQLTFDDSVLAFEMLADGQVTPVSAPWLFIQTLRGGYIKTAGPDGEQLRIQIDDSYAEEALHLDIWIDDRDLPLRAEILWQGRRVVSLDVRNFTYV